MQQSEEGTTSVENPQISELTRKQERFLLAYLTSSTILAACRSCGISDDTGTRWLKMPHVRTRLAELRQEQIDSILAQLSQHAKTAIATLARNLSESAPPAVQVRAAQILLEELITLQKIPMIEAQIADVKMMLIERGYKS